MTIYEETQSILKQYKIQANKALGQNFLIEDNVINTIIENSEIKKEDLIIEIGPGLGVLTKCLLEKSDNVIAIELDKKMVEIISNRFRNNTNLEIINEDILKINLKQIIENKKQNKNIKNVKIVANLPYYISTPIVTKLLEQNLQINEIIVMVQKEVGQRLTAKTGTKNVGAITHLIEYYAEATQLITVPKTSFIPQPNVESIVIKLKIRPQPKIEIENYKLLFKIINNSFLQRRKTLVNALINNKIVKNKNQVEQILDKLNINKNIRAEKLSLEQFVDIYREIYK